MRWAAILALVVGCGTSSPPAAPDAAPTGWSAERATQLGKYRVELAMQPEPPTMGELFQVEAVVRYPDGVPLEDGKVTLDARMPQHGHGMETDPVDDPGSCDPSGRCTHPGGKYRAEGFKFHMGGAWTITVDVAGPQGPDSTSFVYEMPG